MVLTGQGEQEKKIELTPAELVENDLRDNFESDFLEPGIVYEIPLPRNHNQTMGSVSDIQSGVSQELRAVIKVGKELYFIIDTSTRIKSKQLKSPDYACGTFLARFSPDDTAQMVDFSTERTFEGATTRILNTRIQREGSDVSVATSTEGTVGIADEGSNKWIEVFRQKTPEATDAGNSDDKPKEPSTLKLKGGSSWRKWIEVFRQKTPVEHDTENLGDEPSAPNSLRLSGGSSWQVRPSQVLDDMKWSLDRLDKY